MKFLGLSILFVSSICLAHNPMEHACHFSGGDFHAIATADDQIGFCQYGNAYIDSLSVLEAVANSTETIAVKVVKSSSNVVTCEQVGGQAIKGQDLEGFNFDLCQFKDGSLLERRTLQAGANSEFNAGLLFGLSARY